VITQVFGGGGNSGSVYKNDFIELLNRGSIPVDLSTWSVQYASATGTTWSSTTLSGTVQPGHFYLVQEAAGGAGTNALPTADATGTIAMAADKGKVALSKSAIVALTGACPTTDANVVDFVGFGTANTCFLGTGPTPTLSATVSAQRQGGGCSDSSDNKTDFLSAPVAPRNSASSTAVCACP